MIIEYMVSFWLKCNAFKEHERFMVDRIFKSYEEAKTFCDLVDLELGKPRDWSISKQYRREDAKKD